MSAGGALLFEPTLPPTSPAPVPLLGEAVQHHLAVLWSGIVQQWTGITYVFFGSLSLLPPPLAGDPAVKHAHFFLNARRWGFQRHVFCFVFFNGVFCTVRIRVRAMVLKGISVRDHS